MQDMPLDFDGQILIKQEDKSKGYPDESQANNGYPREYDEHEEDRKEYPPEENREEEEEYQQ